MQPRYLLLARLTLAILCSASAGHATAAGYLDRSHALAEHRDNLVIDTRDGHNRYYPAIGTGVRSLDLGYSVSRVRGVPYYFRDGIWYRNRGRAFVVVRPPLGAFVTVLPSFYTTLWFGGVPYYYADNVYYRWDAGRSGYLVSEPPRDAAADTISASVNEVFVYPKNEQNAEQQSKDRYECYRWAADQSGFDPTRTGGGTSTDACDAYQRAQAACLEARGYSVK